jgi:hypothetical protein
MNIQTMKYVELADYCEATGKNYVDVMEAVSNSDISFGTNADTFLTAGMLANILEEDVPAGVESDLMISLGS